MQVLRLPGGPPCLTHLAEGRKLGDVGHNVSGRVSWRRTDFQASMHSHSQPFRVAGVVANATSATIRALVEEEEEAEEADDAPEVLPSLFLCLSLFSTSPTQAHVIFMFASSQVAIRICSNSEGIQLDNSFCRA